MDTNIIYNEDCYSVLQSLPDGSIDMILQDPPYNTTACSWEYDIFKRIDDLWAEWKRVIKPNGVIVMTGSQPFTSRLVVSNLEWFKYELIMSKSQGTDFLNSKRKPLTNHENVLIFYEKLPTYNPQMEEGIPYTTGKRKQATDSIRDKAIYGEPIDNKGTRYPKSILPVCKLDRGLHPTQKPVSLFEYLIKTYTNEGDTVFDGYAGSCTTAVACKNTGRKYICCELDKDYYEKSLARLGSVPKLALS